VKCELVEINEEAEDKGLFKGTIDCAPEDCEIIMHKGQAFVLNSVDEDEGTAIYALTKVAEFTEGKD
jgi:hypothetical protein